MGQDVLLSHFVWCSYCSLWSSWLPETASLALLTTFSTMSGWVLIAAIPILITAEGQDQLENEGQQQKADTEADALIEGLVPVDVHLDDEIDVVDGDQQQKELPAAAVQLLTQHIGVVDGDDALPALTAHLLEDHPLRHQRQDTDNQAQNHTILSPFLFLQNVQNTPYVPSASISDFLQKSTDFLKNRQKFHCSLWA